MDTATVAPAKTAASLDTIDHVNIRTPDVPGTARFLCDVLGLTATASPGNADPEKALWICDGTGRAVIHLGIPGLLYPWEKEAPPPGAIDSTGRVHHVAFRCSGFEAMEERLQEHAIAYEISAVPQVNLRQIFVREPNGLLLELNFFGD